MDSLVVDDLLPGDCNMAAEHDDTVIVKRSDGVFLNEVNKKLEMTANERQE
jgi:hypothetical protein